MVMDLALTKTIIYPVANVRLFATEQGAPIYRVVVGEVPKESPLLSVVPPEEGPQ
jgi:hypothetical protein